MMHHILFQPHSLCSIQEVNPVQFRLPTGKCKGQFFYILGIGNGNIEEIVGWRKLCIRCSVISWLL